METKKIKKGTENIQPLSATSKDKKQKREQFKNIMGEEKQKYRQNHSQYEPIKNEKEEEKQKNKTVNLYDIKGRMESNGKIGKLRSSVLGKQVPVEKVINAAKKEQKRRKDVLKKYEENIKQGQEL